MGALVWRQAIPCQCWTPAIAHNRQLALTAKALSIYPATLYEGAARRFAIITGALPVVSAVAAVAIAAVHPYTRAGLTTGPAGNISAGSGHWHRWTLPAGPSAVKGLRNINLMAARYARPCFNTAVMEVSEGFTLLKLPRRQWLNKIRSGCQRKSGRIADIENGCDG